MQILEKDNKITVTFPPRIETGASLMFEQELAAKMPAVKGQIIFDMNQVEYISSAFIRICIMMSKKVGNDNFKIINASDFVKKVFKLTGLEAMLK